MIFQRLAFLSSPTVRVLLVLTSLFPASLSQNRVESSPEPPSITFAQLTDAHIFDDGWKLSTADALRQTAENRTALHWAIDKINQLIKSGKRIDFVVYTGDLGLQNIEFPAGKGTRDSPCTPKQARVEPGPPMVPLSWAVNEVAAELNQLVVRKVFFVAGNNDIIDENILDTQRFNCFVDELTAAVSTFSMPLEIKRLEADSIIETNGIRLVGLNTASFKKLVNYNEPCSTAAPADAMLREACPLSQMNLLRRTNRPLLVFTHVPDLKDPYRKTASWEIQPNVRQVWEQQICGPSIIAVFAGHFHDSNRAIYGSPAGARDLAVTECVANKTWVAPPLAAKNQTDKSPQARGFLVATVGLTGVLHSDTIWYESAATSTSQQPAEGCWIEVIFIIVMGLLLIGGCVLLIARLGRSHNNRDIIAVLVVLVFLLLAIPGLWLAKSKLGIGDSATLIALLVVPLLLYGIVSGRLKEFSGPGGWGAKFAEQPVDLSLVPVDLKDAQQIENIKKENYRFLQDKIRQGDIHEGPPIILTMRMGAGSYNPGSLNDYLRDLAHFPNFRFVIIVDQNDKLIAYVAARVLKRANDLNLLDFPNLINAVNNGNATDLLRIPGVLTDKQTLTTRTTNVGALRMMEKYDLDAMPVIDENSGKLRAIVERNRILNRMILALAGGGKDQ